MRWADSVTRLTHLRGRPASIRRQFAPPSVVSQTRPVSVPPANIPATRGDSMSIVSAPVGAVDRSALGGSPSSPLTAVQVVPRSVVRSTRLPAAYSVRGSCGEMKNGVYQLKRSGAEPRGSRGRMFTLDGPPLSTEAPVMSMRIIAPFWCS